MSNFGIGDDKGDDRKRVSSSQMTTAEMKKE